MPSQSEHKYSQHYPFYNMEDSNASLYNREILNIYQILNTIQSRQYRNISASHTLTIDDYIIGVDTTTATGNVTITIPDSGNIKSRILIIKDEIGNAAVNNIIIDPATVDIEGAASATISVNRETRTYYYSGTEWMRIFF